jgi:hypothetical protein
MSASPTPNLFQKLVQVTAEIGHIEARGFHSFFKSSYVTEEDLVEAVRSKLTEHNIVMLPSVGEISERPTKDNKTHITTVQIAFTFCDGDSGETHTCQWAGAGEDAGDKGLSKAYTQALRYFLLKAFLVPTGDQAPLADQGKQETRPDGQKAISEEQFQGIVNAWKTAGSDEIALHGLLDAQKVPLQIEGQDLSLSQRVRLLSALQAIDVQKKLIASVPKRVAA